MRPTHEEKTGAAIPDVKTTAVGNPCFASVIVPTFCEAENLPELAQRIHAALISLYRYELIVVDDDSADETVEVCKRLSMRFPIRLEVRKLEKGLSSAVVHGIKRASGDVLVVIDADLSHPPEAIPNLIEPLLSKDAEFVIGSRYCPGGQVADGWEVSRRIRSLVAKWLALPLTRLQDPMAGFFALKRSTFDRATKLNAIGFKIGLELIVRCGCRKVIEIPIEFQPRKFGTSKLTWAVHGQYSSQLLRLYFFRLGQCLRAHRGRKSEATESLRPN